MQNSLAPSSDWRTHLAGAGAWIVPDAIFHNKIMSPGACVHVRGQSLSLRDALPDAARGSAAVWRVPAILSPGFVDLQVNGGGGVLFNTTPTPDGARAIARAHRSTGTAALLPTVITDRPDVTDAACRAIEATIGQDGIIGIHIEGPHIAVARRGTHAAEFVRPLDRRTLDAVAHLRAAAVPVMLTLAPEAVVPGQIADLVGQGVVVALGHSDATGAATRAALAEGAQCFTHLFNAMSPMQNREEGVTGAAINSTAYASVICDGIHVAPEMLGLALRARPLADRTYIVTDAMPTVAGPDSYRLYDQTITLTGGRLINESGALAGAHVTMLASVRYAIEVLGQSVEQALRMAITIPSRLMGQDRLGGVQGRALADLLLIQPDFSSAMWLEDKIGAI